MLGWQASTHSGSICPKLTDGWSACENDTELAFEHTDIVIWSHIPCAALSIEKVDINEDGQYR